MKTVLITGATGAIGKVTVMELAKQKSRLILLGRDQAKLSSVKSEITKAADNADIHLIVADLSEPESVRKAVEEIRRKYTSLNALINVAAIFKRQRLENSKGQEYISATNHLGPFILTTGLLDLLKAGKPARVVTVSAPSVAKINFDDLQGKKSYSSGFMGAFGISKMMNIVFTYALAGRLGGTGITTGVFHPGLVKSDLSSEMPALLNYIFNCISGKPDQAAKMLCSLAIDGKYQDSNGTFFRYDGKEIKSSKYSYDKEIQEKLWMVSEQAIQQLSNSTIHQLNNPSPSSTMKNIL